MKFKKTVFLIALLTIICISRIHAQTDKKHKNNINSTKVVQKNNLLDMQTNVLTSIFGENLDGKSQNKSIGFLELLNKVDLSPEQKAEYRNLYYLQAKDMTQKTKDSLSKVLTKKIFEAKNKQ